MPGRNGLLFPSELPPRHGPPKSVTCYGLICKPAVKLSQESKQTGRLCDLCVMGLNPPSPTGDHSGCEISLHVSPEHSPRHGNRRNAKTGRLARQGSWRTRESWAEGTSSPSHLRMDLLWRHRFPQDSPAADALLNPTNPSAPSSPTPCSGGHHRISGSHHIFSSSSSQAELKAICVSDTYI